MKNHFHFVVKVKPENDIRQYAATQVGKTANKFSEKIIPLDQYLNDQLRRFFSSVSIKFNNRHHRKGQVFARFPKRIFIENEDRLRYLIAYVHHNPIHHRFNSNYSDWEFSSYRTLLNDSPTKLSRDHVMELFGGIEGFNAFHDRFQVLKIEEEI